MLRETPLTKWIYATHKKLYVPTATSLHRVIIHGLRCGWRCRLVTNICKSSVIFIFLELSELDQLFRLFTAALISSLCFGGVPRTSLL